jgi:hypothetical protein
MPALSCFVVLTNSSDYLDPYGRPDYADLSAYFTLGWPGYVVSFGSSKLWPLKSQLLTGRELNRFQSREL